MSPASPFVAVGVGQTREWNGDFWLGFLVGLSVAGRRNPRQRIRCRASRPRQAYGGQGRPTYKLFVACRAQQCSRLNIAAHELARECGASAGLAMTGCTGGTRTPVREILLRRSSPHGRLRHGSGEPRYAGSTLRASGGLRRCLRRKGTRLDAALLYKAEAAHHAWRAAPVPNQSGWAISGFQIPLI